MKKQKVLNIALIGSGGDGIMSSANMILRTAARIGLYGVMTQSYGPQIRGGESAAFVALAAEPITTVSLEKDIIVCFRFADVARFTKEIAVADHTVLFHGVDAAAPHPLLAAAGGPKMGIPFSEVLAQEGLPEIAKNVFVFGMILKVLGWNLKHGNDFVTQAFAHKSSSIVSSNLKALGVGFQYVSSVTLPFSGPTPQKIKERMVLSGNEACAHAAVDAGCRFFAGYPITPSSEIMETMHELLPKVGGRLIQAEDEIASMGMIIGASYGGTPAMTATSGPGLSLMTEMMGLSSIAEIPVVIVDCQRAGPSTGMPSRTEQSDLGHAVFGGHGDCPRVVLAPSDVTDCFQTMHRAFYLAENYQLPVVVLSDASIAQRYEIIDPVDTAQFPRGVRIIAAQPNQTYRRFDLSLGLNEAFGGVNPVALPGTPGGMHSIAGIEHTEAGTPSADGGQHEVMNQKRFLKLKTIEQETQKWVNVYGSNTASHAMITWGSSEGVAQQYLEAHPDTAVFVSNILHPFPAAALQNFLKGRKSVSVLEMNYQGQLFQYLRSLGLLDPKAQSLKRSGGLPFQVNELNQMMQMGGTL